MPVRRPVGPDVRFSPPGWGEMIGEQYILQAWDPSSPETIEEQRTRLARQYAFELVVEPKCRVRERSLRKPTDDEISTILRPWRNEEERLRVLKILHTRGEDMGEAILVRTYYGDEGDEAWEEMIREREENADIFELEEDDYSILDDPALFAAADGDGADGWRTVYDMLPEMAHKMQFGCGPDTDALLERARANPEESLFEKALSSFRYTLKSLREVHGMREPPEDVIENVRSSLQEESVVSFILVADSSTFQKTPAMFRIIYLDARCDIIRHGRVKPVNVGDVRNALAKRHIVDLEGWSDGEVGDKYRPDGSVGARLYRKGMEVMEEHLLAIGLTVLSLDSALVL